MKKTPTNQDLEKSLELFYKQAQAWHYIVIELVESQVGVEKAADFYVSKIVPRFSSLQEKQLLYHEIHARLVYWSEKWTNKT